MTSLTFFSSLPFIFELLGFFMVMVGIAKIKVIDATESCLLSIFSVGNFFANNLIPIWSGLRGLNKKCKNNYCIAY